MAAVQARLSSEVVINIRGRARTILILVAAARISAVVLLVNGDARSELVTCVNDTWND